MRRKSEAEKAILGLKVGLRRKALGLSFQELSKTSGIAISYLNEIEKGKKFPKKEKLSDLSKALQTTPAQLKSKDVSGSHAVLARLIQSNFMEELPLKSLGITQNAALDILAHAPEKLGAFVATLIDITFKYESGQESFYLASIRSSFEMRLGYSKELEHLANSFQQQQKLSKSHAPGLEALQVLLTDKHDFQIVGKDFKSKLSIDADQGIVDFDKKHIIINKAATSASKLHFFAEVLAHVALDSKGQLPQAQKDNAFETSANAYKANYLKRNLMIPRSLALNWLTKFVEAPATANEGIGQMAKITGMKIEDCYFRTIALLNSEFGLKSFYFLEMERLPSGLIRKRQMHNYGKKHFPHWPSIHEHFCRRWEACHLETETVTSATGIIEYINNKRPYLCHSTVLPAKSKSDPANGYTLAIDLSDKSSNGINIEGLKKVPVHMSCERCPQEDCTQRVETNYILEKEKEKILLQKLLNDNFS